MSRRTFMNGIIYCRVSSDEQVKGTSLDSQKEACQEYAAAKKIKILKAFVEQGESAKFADRTQLLELIDFCRRNKGNVDVLIVWKLDRFARNAGDHFNVKAMLIKYGVRIASVTEPIDTSPEGKLMETILAGFAQFDNDIRAMRSVQGMRRKLQEGIFPWKPPLGYVSSTAKGEKKTEPDRPDQHLFRLFQKAWKLFATGGYTKAEMTRMMARWGVRTHKGQSLTPQSIYNFFRNPYYAGILVDPWSGEEYAGKHIPLVSRAEFARVQRINDGLKDSLPHQKYRPEFPLRGLVRCQRCFRYLTGSVSRGRSQRYAYYHCSKRGCERKSYAVDEFHREFRSFLEAVTPKPELLPKLKDVVMAVAQEKLTTLKNTRIRRQTEIARVGKQIQELIRMRTDGLITDEEFNAEKRRISARGAAIEEQGVEEELSSNRIQQDLDEITEPLAELRQTWESLPDSHRRGFERLLLPVGFVNGQVRTAELGLIFHVFGELSRPESNGVPLVEKFWNQILKEISAFSELFKAWRGSKMALPEAVPRNSSE
jgi:site-specific DNA recombinase